MAGPTRVANAVVAEFTTALPVDATIVDVAPAADDGATLVLQHNDGDGTSSLTRVRPDGAVDPAFGTNGVVSVPMAATSLAVPSDGSIIVAGAVVRRYDPSGSLDNTYPGPGVNVTSVFDLAVDSQNRAVVIDGAGTVHRILPDGAEDPGFSNAVLAGTVSRPRLALDSFDRPVILLRTGPRDLGTPLLKRLTNEGRNDQTFGVGGDGPDCRCAPNPVAVAVDADDRVVVADTTSVVRFTTRAQPDVTFGVDGVVTLTGHRTLADIAVAPGGGLVVAGREHVVPLNYDSRAYDVGLVLRVAADGTVACTGGAGVPVDVLAGRFWQQVATGSDGSVVVASSLEFPGGPAFVGRRSALPAPDDPGCTGDYHSVTPTRLVDTRLELGGPLGPVPADGQIDVQIGGRAGIPSVATAVTLTVTAVDALDAGYVTIWPSGSPRPTTSVLNLEGPGDTAAGLVTVPIGRSGLVSLFTQRGADLLVDVSGYWAPAGAGLPIATVEPTRVLDTRAGIGAPAARLAAGRTINVVLDDSRLPFADAIVGTVTVTGATGDGFVTMWSSGERPTVSNLNFGRGQTRSNQFMVPVSTDPDTFVRSFSLYVHAGTDVVVDITGFVPFVLGPDRRPTTSVLRTAGPVRVLDTRDGTGGTQGPISPGGTFTVSVGGPTDGAVVRGVVGTLTLVDAIVPGFLTAWAGGPLPTVSNVNVERAGQTRPIQITIPVAPDGTISVYVHAGGHVLLDVTGYLVG